MTRELDGRARSICVERRGWEARDESWCRAGTILKGSRQCEKKDDELENGLQKRETPQRGSDRPVMGSSYDKSSKAWLRRMDRAGPSARRWGPFMESRLRGSMMSLLLSMEEEISWEEESEDRVKMKQLLSLSFLTALGLGVIRSSTRFPGLFLWLPQRVLSMWKQMRKDTRKGKLGRLCVWAFPEAATSPLWSFLSLQKALNWDYSSVKCVGVTELPFLAPLAKAPGPHL